MKHWGHYFSELNNAIQTLTIVFVGCAIRSFLRTPSYSFRISGVHSGSGGCSFESRHFVVILGNRRLRPCNRRSHRAQMYTIHCYRRHRARWRERRREKEKTLLENAALTAYVGRSGMRTPRSVSVRVSLGQRKRREANAEYFQVSV